VLRRQHRVAVLQSEVLAVYSHLGGRGTVIVVEVFGKAAVAAEQRRLPTRPRSCSTLSSALFCSVFWPVKAPFVSRFCTFNSTAVPVLKRPLCRLRSATLVSHVP